MKLARDFNDFDGCLSGVLKNKWALCVKQDETFGTKPNTGIVTDADIDKIRAYIHSIDNIVWRRGNEKTIQQILYWSLGLSFCLRGRDEHHSLLWSQVRFGKFGKDGPPGMEAVPYVFIANLTDKTHKIVISEYFFFVDFKKQTQQNNKTHLFFFRSQSYHSEKNS